MTEPVGAKALDVTFSRFVMRPLTDDQAVGSNSAAYCGKTDWKKGVDVDVTGLKCGSGGENNASGQKVYSNIRVDQNKVYVGNPKDDKVDDGTSQEKRQKGSETEYPWTKK